MPEVELAFTGCVVGHAPSTGSTDGAGVTAARAASGSTSVSGADPDTVAATGSGTVSNGGHCASAGSIPYGGVRWALWRRTRTATSVTIAPRTTIRRSHRTI